MRNDRPGVPLPRMHGRAKQSPHPRFVRLYRGPVNPHPFPLSPHPSPLSDIPGLFSGILVLSSGIPCLFPRNLSLRFGKIWACFRGRIPPRCGPSTNGRWCPAAPRCPTCPPLPPTLTISEVRSPRKALHGVFQKSILIRFINFWRYFPTKTS